MRIKIKGTNVKTEIKTVPRKKIIAAFVGRLDLSTTEDTLIACLTEAGLTDVKCSKLKGNGNRSFIKHQHFSSHAMKIVMKPFIIVTHGQREQS